MTSVEPRTSILLLNPNGRRCCPVLDDGFRNPAFHFAVVHRGLVISSVLGCPLVSLTWAGNFAGPFLFLKAATHIAADIQAQVLHGSVVTELVHSTLHAKLYSLTNRPILTVDEVPKVDGIRGVEIRF